MRLAAVLVWLFTLLSCSVAGDPQPAQSAPARAENEAIIQNLCQHWRRSHEEERAGENVEVYRPQDSRQFPPSRFRMAYIFHPDGSCEWYYLSPDDAHHFRPGKWKLGGTNGQVLEIQKSDVKQTYRVVELTADLLRLAREPEPANAK